MHVLQQSFWRHLLSKYFMRYFKTSLRSIHEEKRNDFNVLCTIKIFMWLSLWTLILWLWGVNKAFFFKVRPVVFLNQKFLALTQSFSGFFSDRSSLFWPSLSRFFIVFCFCFGFFHVLNWAFRVLTQPFSFYWVGLSLFWLSPSHLLSQSFSSLSQSFQVYCQSFSFFESLFVNF